MSRFSDLIILIVNAIHMPSRLVWGNKADF